MVYGLRQLPRKPAGVSHRATDRDMVITVTCKSYTVNLNS